MSRLEHSELQELCAAHALGSLDPADAVTLEEHLREGCAECRTAVTGFQETASALGSSLTPVPPPPGAERRLMARIASEMESEPAGPLPGRTLRWALPLAASLVAMAGIWLAWEEHGRASRLAVENLDLQQQASASSDPRVFELEATEHTPAASGYLYMDLNDPADDTDDQWKLHADHLLPAPQGATYKAWLVTTGEVLPLGPMESDPEGHGFAVGQLPVVDGQATLQITLESNDSVLAPTGPVILRHQKLSLRRPLPPPKP